MRGGLPYLELSVPVIGAVAEGVLQDRLQLDPGEFHWRSASIHLSLPYTSIIGLEVHKAGLDSDFPEGSVLTCVPIYSFSRHPLPGEKVIAHRYQGDGRVEVIIREVARSPDGGFWLLA